MTATSAGFGFRPVYSPSGIIRPEEFTDGILSTYNTSIFAGDPVLMAATGVLQLAGTNVDILGIFAGVEYTPALGSRRVYSPAWIAGSTYLAGSCYAYVVTDPDVVYEVQANGSVAQAGTGDQADLVPSAGSTITGLSNMQLNSALVGVGNQGQFRIKNLAKLPDNAWGDAFTIVQVQIARHQYRANKTAI